MVTKHVTENPKGNPLANYQFSCTLLRADLSEIEITFISYTNKTGLSVCFPRLQSKLVLHLSQSHSGRPVFKERENERSRVFKHLEKTCATWQTSFPYLPQTSKQTVSLQFLEVSGKTFQRTVLAYRKITEQKGKTGGEGTERGRKRPMRLLHRSTCSTSLHRCKLAML